MPDYRKILLINTGKKSIRLNLLCIIIFILFFTSKAYSQSFEDLLKQAETHYESFFFNEALDFTRKALNKADSEYGKSSIQYASALEMNGRIFMINGEYEASEKAYLDVIEILERSGSKGVPLFGKVNLNLAQLYSYMGNFSKAEKTFTISNEVNKSIHGESSIEYAESLYRTAAMYFDFYKYEQAEKAYIKALQTINESNKAEYELFTQILDDMSVMYEEQNMTEKMIPLLNDLMDFTVKTKGKEHPDYKLYLIRTAEVYFRTGREKDAEPLISEAISTDIEGIKDSFYYLSESDKLFMMDYYLQNADLYYSLAMERGVENKALMDKITDFRLMTKALVLFTTNGVKKRILANEDPSVKKLYEELLGLKTLLSKSYTRTKTELEKEGIDIKTLESKAKDMERNLASLSYFFETDREQYEINWNDVRNSLKDDETAVDFMDFTDIKGNKDDTVYCAIIIRRDYDSPMFIKLCRKVELDKIINQENTDGVYIKNSEANKSLYTLIWKPLENFIGNSGTVYLSPSGLLNKVSFHALSRGNNDFLIDKYNIVYKGNLKEIINKGESKKSGQGNSTVIFGGLLYDVEPSVMSENAARMRNYNSDDFVQKPDMTKLRGGDIERAGGWKYLKGTVTESDNILNTLSRNNFEATLHKGAEGNEEAFKSLSGNNSPYIIHLATHGFFFPEPQKSLNKDGKKNIPTKSNDAFIESINPMLRSGVVLSGANNVWKKGESIEGAEDGVLTAYEVSDMNLSGTEIVVLSACESGLGDMKGVEGVFGLQRAFKIAGAKNLIVSLWKVPDKETAELMEAFYINLAEKKMSIRDSFNNAQKEMRDKYSDPYFWAAFILI